MDECRFVISRWPGVSAWPDGTRSAPDLEGVDPTQARELEDELASALAARGAEVLVIPHLYYLSGDHPALRRLREVQGDLVVASWLSPRALRWVLRAQGVGWEGRSVSCVALRGCGSVEDPLLECARLGGWVEGASQRSAGHVEEIADAVAPRWYPVLDYSLCEDCRQCMDFCLFGVHTVEEGRVRVTSPENCKPGCPACARLCPHGAIMFPHYAADPAIAGFADVAPEGTSVAGSPAPAGGGREPCPVCGCACDCERSLDGTAPQGKSVCPACGCICDTARMCARGVGAETQPTDVSCSCAGSDDADDLDDLINALEHLDD